MKYTLRTSITGILSRFFQKGFTYAELKKAYAFPIQKFITDFEKAKKAHDEGDQETVKAFFNIYC